MGKKVYISPSSQSENRYSWGNTNEQEQCNKIALATVKALKRCGIEAKTNTNSDMYKRTAESNCWKADIHVPIHTNALNGKVQGTRLFCVNFNGEGYKVCEEVMKTLAPITPGTSDSITVASFYEITDTNAPCCYIEIAFHDNVEEAKFIVKNTEKIAEAIARGLCNYLGVKYVSSSTSSNVSRKKTIEELANEVIAGKWGKGADRKKRLTEAGYDYNRVQARVNEKLR